MAVVIRSVYWLLALLLPLASLADIRVTDAVGREVVLQKPAARIVALAPHAVENLFSAGAGDKIVGAVSYSDYPIAAQKITRVGTYKAFSAETILSLEPDLIVMWASGNGMRRLQELSILNVPIYVSEAREIGDIGKAIRDFEILTGNYHGENSEANRIDQQFAELRERYGKKENLSMFYQVWNEPLQTLNGEHMLSRVMELCGASNIFADATSLAPRISIESVLERDPDLIVASGMGSARPEWLDEWKAYPFLKSVKNNALYFIHPDHLQRPTARLLLGAKTLCEQVDQQRN